MEKKKYNHIIRWAFWGSTGLILFLFLQYRYAFYFLYIEQLQLFPLTNDYFIQKLSTPGGFVSYLAEFMTQFYSLPYVGASMTTILFLFGCFCMQKITNKLAPAFDSLIVVTVPMACFCLLQLDMNYRQEGTVAFILVLVFFYLFICLPHFYLRLTASVIIPVILFGLAGPTTTLFITGVVIWALQKRPPREYWSLLSIPTWLMLSWLSCYQAWQSNTWESFIPNIYYTDLSQVSNLSFLYCAWISFPVSLFITVSIGRKIHIAHKRIIFFRLFELGIIFAGFWFISEKTQDTTLLANMEQDYYLRNKRWKDIISTFPAQKSDLQTINILNLALSNEGKLDQDLFKYPQRGGETLLSNWDERLSGAIAQADLHYMIGNIGAAQKYAYEGYILSPNGNPRLLKRLIDTNLIFGFYPVAEKYITILEQTCFYKKWAQEHRKYLNNDKMVESDSEYGHKRKALKENPDETVCLDFTRVLERLAANNPDNPIPLLYLTTFHLLNKDLTSFDHLYKKYYQTKIWPTLTIRQQEAVIAWYEDQRPDWPEKGISPETGQRYLALKGALQNHNLGNKAIASFEDTYWYYLLFKKE